MKTLEMMEKEYEEYKIESDFVTHLERFSTFIEVGMDTLEEEFRVIRKEIKKIIMNIYEQEC